MSTLFELKDEILKGRRVKRGEWIGFTAITDIGRLDLSDALSDDWKLEPKEKKKVKLYAYINKCALGIGASLLFFHNDESSGNWTRLPNLDQEIEVDE